MFLGYLYMKLQPLFVLYGPLTFSKEREGLKEGISLPR